MQDAYEYVEALKERAAKLLTSSYDESTVYEILIQVDPVFRAKAVEEMRSKRATSFGKALLGALKSEHNS